MPITVNQLATKFGLVFKDPLRWSEPIPTKKSGVYIISSSLKPDKNEGATDEPIFSKDALTAWKKTATGLELFFQPNPSIDDLAKALKMHWHKNENILYIGKTSNLNKRLNDFYEHQVGYPSPHLGGFWLKLLENLYKLRVYYTETDQQDELEFKLLLFFVENLKGESYTEIKNIGQYLPFANRKIDIEKQTVFKNQTKKK